MDLYIIRHAIAEERRDALPDAERQLTARGEKRFRRCVNALAELEITLERVSTSPWTRAAQTAALLEPLAEAEPTPEAGLARAPDPDLLSALASSGAERLAVVGHEPWLGQLTAWLITGEPPQGEAPLRLKKGGVAHLRGELRPGGMELRALLPPKVLLAVG